MIEFIARYWLEALFGLIMAGFGYCIKRILTEFKALRKGTQAILRNGIIEQYNKWKGLGYIPIYALENVEALYKEYHALGGNGTITQLYEELQELSKRKEEISGL